MSDSSNDLSKPLLSDRSYAVLKRSATIILPAIGTLYFTLAQIWRLPNAEQVVGSIAAVNTFLGVIVGLSKKSYYASGAPYAGVINVTEEENGKQIYNFDVKGKVQSIATMPEVTFKVVNDTGSNPIIRP